MRTRQNSDSLISNVSINKYSYNKHEISEIKVMYNYLKNNIATASMIEDVTGIKQKNITWYKRTLERQGKLFKITYNRCLKTNRFAWWLTTNENLKPPTNQLELFE